MRHGHNRDAAGLAGNSINTEDVAAAVVQQGSRRDDNNDDDDDSFAQEKAVHFYTAGSF